MDCFYASEENQHFEIHAHYYLAGLAGPANRPVEDDHWLVWLSAAGAARLLQRPGQAWAVARAVSSLPLIRLEGVSVHRDGRELLDKIDWEIHTGQHWAVVGPNGGGKTLLMQVIQGSIPCSAGRVKFADAALPAQISRVSFEQHQELVAFEQDQAFFRQFSKSGDEGRTVRQWLQDARLSLDTDPVMANLIQTLELSHLVDSPLVALSNGEMRKWLIVRAMGGAPRILILDEPFDGLDTVSRRRLAETIEHVMDMGTQILLVTHRPEEISSRFTHLLGLQGGRLYFADARQPAGEDELFARLYHQPAVVENVSPAGAAIQPVLLSETHCASQPSVMMKDVCIKYGKKVVLDHFNWVANRDENWAIIGPNGAGKSTLLRLISADHLQAYANEIHLFGRRRGSGESIWEIKQKIGVLSPEFQIGYRENLLAGEVVLSGFFDSIGLYRHTRPEQEAQAQYWLNLLGIEDLAQQDFNRLSYGQKRMLLLARALVKSPEMLLLDEPCQGLDRENCQRLVQMVSLVSVKAGTQIFYVTHRPDELPACITDVLEFEHCNTDLEQEQHYTTKVRRTWK